MKKKLEADLISIAHRVLQMKNKSDIDQLYIETQKLYEKLSVLKFVEEHFGDSKPTIGQAEIIEKIEQIDVFIPVAVAQPEEIIGKDVAVEEIVEEETIVEEVVAEVIEPVVAELPEIKLEEITVEEVKETPKTEFIPAFELDKNEEKPKKESNTQIFSFEDLLGANYDEPQFVKVDHNKANPLDFDLPNVTNVPKERLVVPSEILSTPKNVDSATASVVDKQAIGLNIGLNDRIAFVKHLFGNSNEDYVRVLNQLITFDNFNEAQDFIENMVKPDYNNWEGKEDYSERFIQIIEKKFA